MKVSVSVASASQFLSISFSSHIISFLSSPLLVSRLEIFTTPDRSHLTLFKRIPPRFSTAISALLLACSLIASLSLHHLVFPRFFSFSIIHLHSHTLCSSLSTMFYRLSDHVFSLLSLTLGQHHLLYHLSYPFSTWCFSSLQTFGSQSRSTVRPPLCPNYQ